jgi:histidinol-phosphatase
VNGRVTADGAADAEVGGEVGAEADAQAGAASYGPAWSAALRRGSEAELQEWLESALRWCDEADDISLGYFGQELQVAAKADRSFVTQADTEVEERLRTRIGDRYPSHGILGEEFADVGAGRSVRWIVDPIDATHNFVRGIPVYATLIAVERDGELQAGVVSAPALGSRWFASRGGGAWAWHRRAGRAEGVPGRIRVSGVRDLAEAQVLYSSPRSLHRAGAAPGFDGLVEAAWRERGLGDFWGYALVAQGSAEIHVEHGLSPYDLAAPAIVVEEAGGRVTDVDGTRRIDGRSAVATNGLLHTVVLARLRSTGVGGPR